MSIKGRAQAALTSHRCIRRQKESIAATYINMYSRRDEKISRTLCIMLELQYLCIKLNNYHYDN